MITKIRRGNTARYQIKTVEQILYQWISAHFFLTSKFDNEIDTTSDKVLGTTVLPTCSCSCSCYFCLIVVVVLLQQFFVWQGSVTQFFVSQGSVSHKSQDLDSWNCFSSPPWKSKTLLQAQQPKTVREGKLLLNTLWKITFWRFR